MFIVLKTKTNKTKQNKHLINLIKVHFLFSKFRSIFMNTDIKIHSLNLKIKNKNLYKNKEKKTIININTNKISYM